MANRNFRLFHILNLATVLSLSTLDSCGTTNQNGCVSSAENSKSSRNNRTYCDTINLQLCPPINTLRIYTTSDYGERLSLSESRVNYNRFSSGPDFTINVDPCQKRQTVLGFGGTFTDACALNLQCLSAETRTCFLNSYFSCSTGLGYSFIRTPLGSSDFSPEDHNLLNEECAKGFLDKDEKLECCNPKAKEILTKCVRLTKMDELKLNYIKEAKRISCRCIHIMAAMWAVPSWMTFNIPVLSPVGLNRTYIKEECYDVFAHYYYMVAQAYSLCSNNDGCSYYLSPGNEVVYGDVDPAWEKPQYMRFLKDYFCKTFQRNQCGAKLIGFDSINAALPVWKSILEDEEINSCLNGGFATHAYLDNLMPTSEIVSEIFHDKYPYKNLFSTEFSISREIDEYYYYLATEWERAERYIRDIISKLQHWYEVYIDWSLCLNCENGPNHRGFKCYSPVQVDCEADAFYKHIPFYAFAHFSRAALPGSVVIQATVTLNSGSNQIPLINKPFPSKTIPVEMVAFKVPVPNCKEPNVAVVILNSNAVKLEGNICVAQYGCAPVKMPPKSIVTAALTLPNSQC